MGAIFSNRNWVLIDIFKPNHISRFPEVRGHKLSMRSLKSSPAVNPNSHTGALGWICDMCYSLLCSSSCHLIAAVQSFLPQLHLQFAGCCVEIAAEGCGLQLLLCLLFHLFSTHLQVPINIKRSFVSFWNYSLLLFPLFEIISGLLGVIFNSCGISFQRDFSLSRGDYDCK